MQLPRRARPRAPVRARAAHAWRAARQHCCDTRVVGSPGTGAGLLLLTEDATHNICQHIITPPHPPPHPNTHTHRNTTRHLEAWYGIMGLGAVCHTLNPRLSAKDIAWIADHAADEWIMADAMFLPLLEQVVPQCPSVKGVILLTDRWVGGWVGPSVRMRGRSPWGRALQTRAAAGPRTFSCAKRELFHGQTRPRATA